MKIMRLNSAVLLLVSLVVGLVRTATAQDFTFSIEPSSLTLVPGQSASFVVSLTPFDGFTNEVTLYATNLPPGVTAAFYPQTRIPPGTSLLTLEATTNASTGSFTLGLTAVGGGITNTVSGTVSVSFGLLPICYGAFQGTVTDIQTGLPVPYAVIYVGDFYYALANANGQYLITNLSLSSSENLPVDYGITAGRSNYWSSSTNAYAVCDATNVVNLEVLLQQEGSISGVLTAEGGAPLTNVLVNLIGPASASTNTDATGSFQFKSLPLALDNQPEYYDVQARPLGYWEVTTNIIVAENSNTVVDLVAIPICYATVTGSVIYSNTGLPAAGISVSVSTEYSYFTTTDSNGDYTVTNVTLGIDNAAVDTTVEASATGYYAGVSTVTLSNCNETLDMGVLSLAPVPVITYNYGAVAGHVYDVQTGLPITNAFVGTYLTPEVETDTNGAYVITNILVGANPTTNAEIVVSASANGYFGSGSNVVVNAGQTATQNFYLLRMGYGGVKGTVLNALTGVPVAGVYVSIASGVTGANGQYASGALGLNTGNVPTYESFYAQLAGYWTAYTNTTITNGLTNIVNIQFIQVCTGATIVGNVVNALNEQPITNASISVSSQYLSAMTDSNGNFILTNLTVGNNNSPIETTITASAPGFNPQSKTVTIFCDATISTTFGAPETVFGAIDGFVTNAVTGQPLTNVFIGSEFGEATTTDTNGYYILTQAPLGPQGSNRTWTVTAGPVTISAVNYPAQTKSVVVSSNMTNLLSFGFGQPPTELIVSATGTPNPVTVGSNLLYTITLTNSAAAAANVVLADTLPANVTFISASITNNPGGVFSEPTLSNGVVSTTATNFSSDSVVMLLVTVTPTAAGTLTNVSTVTSTTPDVNPSGTNRTATVISTAIAAVVPLYADIGLTMTNAPNPVLVSNQLTYTLLVSNSGPANAPAVVLTDSLPANVTFFSASVSQGSYSLITNGVAWNIGAINDEGTASATVVVLPLQTGEVTNTATVSLTPTVPSVTDTNLANNTASDVATVTTATLTNISLEFGPITFNPQTGLFQQTVQVDNLSGVTAAAVRVAVTNLSSGITLYNASGSTNGVPYVQYDQPVLTGSNVVFLLEYYESTREPFVSTNFAATVVAAVTVPTPTGTILQLDTTPFLSEGQLTIEFASVPGHTYVVQYSSDMQTWLTATPPIVAANTRTQWIDAGPPETESSPGIPGQRFYRIVQTN
jgi:uncharacterized repeat protein (TIGR01451 family)